ncbi:MAG: TatD family hydrolase [Chloroflexota bacterium]|jgi:TatD DNase family protein|nr:TatD family hydrolase [Chloroflexota bacterium]
MNTSIFADAHSHLDQFEASEIPGILRRAEEVGVNTIVVAGVTVQSSIDAIALAEQNHNIFAGIGIQPSDVTRQIDEGLYRELTTLAQSSRKVVCVSEIGLDFTPGMPDIGLQTQAFRAQIALALDLGLPVIFHSRERPGHQEDHLETLRVLDEEKVKEVGGAFHYFMWDPTIANKCFEMNLLVSLSKTLLRLPHLQQIVKDLPLNKLVLETDSYPQTFKKNRSRWTEPKDIPSIAAKVAELKQLTVEDVANVTTSNLLELLHLSR